MVHPPKMAVWFDGAYVAIPCPKRAGGFVTARWTQPGDDEPDAGAIAGTATSAKAAASSAVMARWGRDTTAGCRVLIRSPPLPHDPTHFAGLPFLSAFGGKINTCNYRDHPDGARRRPWRAPSDRCATRCRSRGRSPTSGPATARRTSGTRCRRCRCSRHRRCGHRRSACRSRCVRHRWS